MGAHAELLGDVVFDGWALEIFLDLDTVEAVISSASFPSVDGVAAALITFNDEFELEPLAGYFCYLGVGKLREPIVSFRPLHLDSTFSIILIRVPLAQHGAGTDEPNILSEIRLIVTADPHLGKLDELLVMHLGRRRNRADPLKFICFERIIVRQIHLALILTLRRKKLDLASDSLRRDLLSRDDFVRLGDQSR